MSSEEDETLEYVSETHDLYERYRRDWQLCINSFHGGVEYKAAKYLRAYASDTETASETINTYSIASDGSVTAKYKAKIENMSSARDAQYGRDDLLSLGSFYGEKLENTPLYNYVKLIVSEYNAVLFRHPPQRQLPDTTEVQIFAEDCDGEGNSLNEFMSVVDQLSTVFGVVHVSCLKSVGSDIPRWRVHTPLDVTNWEYYYDRNGNLVLGKMVILLDENDEMCIYRCMDAEYIDTVFVGPEDDDDFYPEVPGDLERLDKNVYRIREVNELGYIPVVTVYQGMKIYNGVGSTVIQDVAQIQRSIYGDMAEIYAAITYGSHPVLIIDEDTDQINGGSVGAEPGSVIRVRSNLTNQPSHVYEFASPDLSAIQEIQNLVDNKVQKINQIAMLRSEDFLKTSTSGAQIEVYDDKLHALIRKKATNLENAEYKLWQIWLDWLNITNADIEISYNKYYNKRALETEIAEINQIMDTLVKYQGITGPDPALQAEMKAMLKDRMIQLLGATSTQNGQ